jgi:hypothetical protein
MKAASAATTTTKPRLCGSGVVCYALRDGALWLLLGRERDTPGWHQGSRRWSSFSGRSEGGESELQNAAREFLEESCSAVGLDGDAAELPPSAAAVERSLARAGVLERCFTARGEAARHVTFVARVPLADQVATFAAFRRQLLRLDAVFRSLYRARKACETAPRLALPGFAAAPQLVTQDFSVEDAVPAGAAPRLVLTLWDGRRGEAMDFEITWKMAAELRRVREAQGAVRAALAQPGTAAVLSHPAVRVTCVGGVPAYAHVDRAYLEKSELRWFAAADLVRARLEGGLAENFRRCFVEALPDVIGCIADVEGGGAQRAEPGSGDADLLARQT